MAEYGNVVGDTRYPVVLETGDLADLIAALESVGIVDNQS